MSAREKGAVEYAREHVVARAGSVVRFWLGGTQFTVGLNRAISDLGIALNQLELAEYARDQEDLKKSPGDPPHGKTSDE